MREPGVEGAERELGVEEAEREPGEERAESTIGDFLHENAAAQLREEVGWKLLLLMCAHRFSLYHYALRYLLLSMSELVMSTYPLAPSD